MRRGLVVVATLVGAFLLVACSPEERMVWDRVNVFRTSNGVHELAWEEGAYGKATAWSQKMAADGRLSHSRLSDGVDAPWRRLGENVAVAGSVDRAIRALEASPGHRANLLNPDFDRFAVGVHFDGTRYWVTQVFLG